MLVKTPTSAGNVPVGETLTRATKEDSFSGGWQKHQQRGKFFLSFLFPDQLPTSAFNIPRSLFIIKEYRILNKKLRILNEPF